MSKHIFRGLGALVLAVLVTFFTSAPVLAADLRSGDTVTVASGDVVDDDLYVAGDTVIVDGTINGDLWAVGREVTVNGTVNGSLVAVAQTVEVNGDVAHAARLAGETLHIRGNVEGDLIAFGNVLNITSVAKVGGDLLFGAGNVSIDGLIEGDVKGGGGEVTVTNGVRGDIELGVDNLTIASTADIQGDLTYTSENEADIQSGAQVGGTTTYNVPEVEEPAKAGFFAVLAGMVTGKVLGFLMALVIGVIIIFVATRRITSMADSIRSKPWPSLGWGAVILFVTPIAAIFVCITVIGLPVGLIALALYGIAIYLSLIPVALLIGWLVIGRFREVKSKGMLVGALATGLAILVILKLIPFLGFFIGLATALFGLGALVVLEKRLRAEAREVTLT